MEYCEITDVKGFLEKFPKMEIEELINKYKGIYNNPAAKKLKEMMEARIVEILSNSFPTNLGENKEALRLMMKWLDKLNGGCHGTSAIIKQALDLIERRIVVILKNASVIQKIPLEEVLEFYRTCYCCSNKYAATRIMQDEIIRRVKLMRNLADVYFVEKSIFNDDNKLLNFWAKRKKETAEENAKNTDSINGLIELRNQFGRNVVDEAEKATDSIEKKLFLKIAEIPPISDNMEKFYRLDSFISDHTMSVPLRRIVDEKVSETVDSLKPTVGNMELLVRWRNKFGEFGQYDFARGMARILKIIFAETSDGDIDDAKILTWLRASILKSYISSCLDTPSRWDIRESDATEIIKTKVLEKIKTVTKLNGLLHFIDRFGEFFALKNLGSCLLETIKEKMNELIDLSSEEEIEFFLAIVGKKYRDKDHWKILSIVEERFVNRLINATSVSI